MAIKINGDVVIDEVSGDIVLDNVASITYGDDTVQTSAGAGGAPNVTTTTDGGTLLHTLDNINAYSTSAYDQFSYSVAISGKYAIVGAYWEDDAGGSDSGKAYIYDVTTGNLLHTLDNPNAYNTSAGDIFGKSVAISGNYAIVGANGEDDAGGISSGKAYIFDVSAGNLLHTLDNPTAYDTSASDNFGTSVAISGNYAIVGADNEGDASGSQSGKAYIFDVYTGNLLHTLDNPNPYSTASADYFAYSVAISGNYAIVGAYAEDDSGGNNSGKAYIFEVATGNLVHTIDNPNAYSTSQNDNFGKSVAISGNYAVVSTNYEADAGGISSGKAYIFDVTTGSLLHTLDNPNAYGTSAIDFFGASVAIDGNYAIVGANGEDDAGGGGSGKAYIFDVTTGTLLHTLDNPNAYSTGANDLFGYTVAISGNYAIVGAYGEADAGGTYSGKAYIFNVNDNIQIDSVNKITMSNGLEISGALKKLNEVAIPSGNLLHTLDNPNAYSTSNADNFGRSVAISGKYAIVGAYLEEDASGTYSGKAYIFDVSTGAFLHTLDNPNPYGTSASDYFGWSVAISGNYAIVSAYQEDDAGGTESGKAYIFDVTSGNLVHTLDNPNAYSTSNMDKFGYSVAISGNYAIVGAYWEDDAGGNSSGKAYIFDVSTGNLLRTLDNPNAYSISDGDFFGESVAISGNYAIVGGTGEDDAGGSNSGKAYIFDVTTGNLLHTLDNPNPYNTSFADYFGNSVGISGNYAIVGASGEDEAGVTTSGKAYIFDVSTGNLLHTLDNPNPYSTASADYFAYSVAISDNYAIVGAYREDEAGGTESGKAYIFDVTSGNLVHTLDNPNAYSTSASDEFGWPVAISGNYAIVGAPGEDDAGGNVSGKAYIFSAKDITKGDVLLGMVS